MRAWTEAQGHVVGRSVLLRVETRAGHGQGKPIATVVEEWTDVWTFLFAELGMEP